MSTAREIKRMYGLGLTLREIADDLNRRGVPRATVDSAWCRFSVSRIVKKQKGSRYLKRLRSDAKSCLFGRNLAWARVYIDEDRTYIGPLHDSLLKVAKCESKTRHRVNHYEIRTIAGIQHYDIKGVCVVLIDNDRRREIAKELGVWSE